jgi:hypothetical protein
VDAAEAAGSGLTLKAGIRTLNVTSASLMGRTRERGTPTSTKSTDPPLKSMLVWKAFVGKLALFW